VPLIRLSTRSRKSCGKQNDMSTFGWEPNVQVHFWLGTKHESPVLVGNQTETIKVGGEILARLVCYPLGTQTDMVVPAPTCASASDSECAYRPKVKKSIRGVGFGVASKMVCPVLLPNQKWETHFASQPKVDYRISLPTKNRLVNLLPNEKWTCRFASQPKTCTPFLLPNQKWTIEFRSQPKSYSSNCFPHILENLVSTYRQTF
jgi:hypothetical protein